MGLVALCSLALTMVALSKDLMIYNMFVKSSVAKFVTIWILFLR